LRCRRDAGATETKKAANISPPFFIHTGELLFEVSLAPVITHVAQVPTSFPTIATEIFAVVVEVAFIVMNVALIGAYIPTIVTQVAAIGAKIAMIVFQIFAVGTDVGSLFGGGSGITVSNVLPQFPSILLYVGLIGADVAAVAISIATILVQFTVIGTDISPVMAKIPSIVAEIFAIAAGCVALSGGRYWSRDVLSKSKQRGGQQNSASSQSSSHVTLPENNVVRRTYL
jgi:hypothetical protein